MGTIAESVAAVIESVDTIAEFVATVPEPGQVDCVPPVEKCGAGSGSAQQCSVGFQIE